MRRRRQIGGSIYSRLFLHLGGARAAKSRRAQPHFFRAPVSVVR